MEHEFPFETFYPEKQDFTFSDVPNLQEIFHWNGTNSRDNLLLNRNFQKLLVYGKTNKLSRLRACLHEGGGPQVREVTCGGLPHFTCKRDHIKMRDYVDRRVTPPKRVTSSIWGPPPPCKQALSENKNKNYPVYENIDLEKIISFSLGKMNTLKLNHWSYLDVAQGNLID